MAKRRLNKIELLVKLSRAPSRPKSNASPSFHPNWGFQPLPFLSFFDTIRVSRMRISLFLIPVRYAYLRIFLFLIPFGVYIAFKEPTSLGKITLVSLWCKMVFTQMITWVYQDYLTLTYHTYIKI